MILRHVNQLWLCFGSSRDKWATGITGGQCKQKIEVRKISQRKILQSKPPNKNTWVFWEALQRTRHSWRNNLLSGGYANGNSPKETPKEKTRNCTRHLRTVGEVAKFSVALWSQNQSYWLFCFVWLDFSVFDLFCHICLALLSFKDLCALASVRCAADALVEDREPTKGSVRSRLNCRRPGEPDSVNPAAVHCAPWPQVKRKPIA